MHTRLRRRFAELHEQGCFVMPNPWDVGSAVRFEALGFPALATTSSGFAWSIGKDDQQVTLDELCVHVEALVAAVDVPVHVDAERCFADTPDGVVATVERLAGLGASGVSIEDWSPAEGAVEPIEAFVPRVAAAAEAAHRVGMTLTARAECVLYGTGDMAEAVERLRAYGAAGADVLYAPGLDVIADVRAVVDAVDGPVNVLLWGSAFTPSELAAVGVRRVSTGGALARVAYDAAEDAAARLLVGDAGP